MQALITARHGSRDVLLFLDLDERTTAEDLGERLAAEVGAPRGSTMYVDGSPVPTRRGDGAEVLVAASGVRNGTVVTFAADPAGSNGILGGPVDLCVTGGTGTGTVVRLGVGESVVQVGQDGRVRVDEPREGGQAAVAVVVALDGGVRVRRVPDPRSAARPVHLDRLEDPLGEEEAPWAAGTQLRIGPSVLTVQAATRPDADLRPAAQPGHLDYNRPPRLLPPMPVTHFRLPAEPAPPAPAPGDGPADTDPVGGVPFDQLPPATQTEVRRLRQADRAAREALKGGMTPEMREQIGRALGFIEETPPAAEDVTARVSQLTSSLADAQRANMVLLAAPDAGARAASLLDSRSFTESIAGLEPTDSAGITAAIKTWIDAHPEHRAAPALPPAPGPGRPGGDQRSSGKSGLEAAVAAALPTTGAQRG